MYLSREAERPLTCTVSYFIRKWVNRFQSWLPDYAVVSKGVERNFGVVSNWKRSQALTKVINAIIWHAWRQRRERGSQSNKLVNSRLRFLIDVGENRVTREVTGLICGSVWTKQWRVRLWFSSSSADLLCFPRYWPNADAWPVRHLRSSSAELLIPPCKLLDLFWPSSSTGFNNHI